MNLKEFRLKYQVSQHTRIDIQCYSCKTKRQPLRFRAEDTIKKFGTFLCRSCGMKRHHAEHPRGKETHQKQRAGRLGYKASIETKQKMSESKKEFYKTPQGQKIKKILSQLAAEGHASNKFENSKRAGLYPSTRTGRLMVYASSYELRLCWMLDQPENDHVRDYQTQIPYTIGDRSRSLDFLVEYKDGKVEAIEVKPKKRITEQENKEQLADSQVNAEKNGWLFSIYTEDQFGMEYKEIRNWADALRKTITGIDYEAVRKENNVKKTQRHYKSKIQTNTVTAICDFCKEDHTILRLSYDQNLEKNGRYICIKENGQLIGQRPKDYLKKENPYAAEGKKKCLGECGLVLDFNQFGDDKSRSDGKATRCKACRAAKSKATYNSKVSS